MRSLCAILSYAEFQPMRVSPNILLLLLSFDPLLLLSHAVSNYLVFYFPLFAFHPFPSCLPKCILFYIIFHLLKKTKDLQIIVCHTYSQGRASVEQRNSTWRGQGLVEFFLGKSENFRWMIHSDAFSSTSLYHTLICVIALCRPAVHGLF